MLEDGPEAALLSQIIPLLQKAYSYPYNGYVAIFLSSEEPVDTAMDFAPYAIGCTRVEAIVNATNRALIERAAHLANPRLPRGHG